MQTCPPPSVGSKVKASRSQEGQDAPGPGPQLDETLPAEMGPVPECSDVFVSAATSALCDTQALPECLACHKKISGERALSYWKRNWHKKCFKCTYCRRVVVGREVMLLGDSLFCASHKAAELRFHTREEVRAAQEARVKSE